jgi:hypothetical protein
MATTSSYYLNAPSLGSATAVFTDDALTECAPDGFYSNGVIVREQADCVLLPQQECPSCEVSISLGAPICRQNNCNDNAACSVRYAINTTNAPAGSYITRTTGTPSSTATVTVSDSTPPTGELLYFEPSGSATPVYFTLELRNSGGTIIATYSTSLTHQSFWPMLPLCPI